MKFPFCKSVFIALLLIAAKTAYALGLGAISGQPVLGQPLLLEIPLLGSEDGIPGADCFKVRPPTAEIESAFVLRNSQVQVAGERGRAKLILSTVAPVREPVIEFGLAIGCGFEISKDYVLLAAEPSRWVAPTDAIKLPASAPAEPSQSAATVRKSDTATIPATAGSTDKTLRITNAVNLAKLAQQHYPLQPKAREKFMRMMTQANPGLIQGDGQIAAASELRLPPGLPVRRLGPYKPESAASAAKSPAVATKPLVAPAEASRPNPVPEKSRHDLLVLGPPGQKNAAELLAEAERLTAILMEQTNTQSATVEKITQLEDTLNSLKKNFTNIESRLNKIEVERQSEKLAAKPLSLDFIELLLAVAAGGAIGALTLHFYNRMRARRTLDQRDSGGAATQLLASRGNSAGLPESGKTRQSDGLPWQKGHEPTGKSARGVNASSSESTEKQDLLPLVEEMPEPAKPQASPQNDFDFVSKQSP